MFRHRHALRRWAACMLLLWLFGLATGVANACIGSAHGASAVMSDPVPDQAVDPTAVLPGSCDGTGDHHGSVAKTNCQDFCGKATVSIPSVKSALDDIVSQALVVAASATALPMPAFVPAPAWLPRRDGVLATPIPIAFLRLTL